MELRRKEGHLGLRITHKHRGLIALVSFLFIDFLLHQCLFSLYGWHGGRGELRRGNVDSTNNVVGGRQAGKETQGVDCPWRWPGSWNAGQTQKAGQPWNRVVDSITGAGGPSSGPSHVLGSQSTRNLLQSSRPEKTAAQESRVPRVVRGPHMGILSAKVFTLMITNFARLWHHGQSACILAETTRTRVRQQSSNAWTLQSLWRVSVFTWAALNQPFGRAEIGADVGLQPAHSKPCFMLLAATVSLALSCILTNQSSHKMKRRRSRSAFHHYLQVFFVTRAIKCTLGKGWSFTASSHCAQCNSLVYPSPSLGGPVGDR